MSRWLGLLLIAVLAGISSRSAASIWTQTKRGPMARNHRGVWIPVALGVAVGGTILTMGSALAILAVLSGPEGRGDAARLAPMVGGVALVLAVGYYDDIRPGMRRGLIGHLTGLLRGEVTTGIVKLVGITTAALLVAAVLSADRPARLLLGVPLMAGAANAWNLLDVVPGRAMKYFLPPAVATTAFAWDLEFGVLGAASLGAVVAVMGFELRERAMLGDAGANVLGFVVGLGLFRVLPTWGLGVALALVLVLHAMAETVTLSRIIEATPPLRWFDRLGRQTLPPFRPF